MELLHKELTFALRKYMIEVHNEIGVGFDEETYHQGLMRRFMKAGMPFVSKQQRELLPRGESIRTFELDYLADDKVIVELKCLRCGFLRANYNGKITRCYFIYFRNAWFGIWEIRISRFSQS